MIESRLDDFDSPMGYALAFGTFLALSSDAPGGRNFPELTSDDRFLPRRISHGISVCTLPFPRTFFRRPRRNVPGLTQLFLVWQGGGMHVSSSYHIYLTTSIFTNNSAPLASAIYFASKYDSLLSNCTFADHPSGTSMILATKALKWHCPLGRYMPQSGEFKADSFVGCLYGCPLGTIGNRPNFTSGVYW